MDGNDRQVGQVVHTSDRGKCRAVPVGDDAFEDRRQGGGIELEALGCPGDVVTDGDPTKVDRDLQHRPLGQRQVLGGHRDLRVAERHRVLLDVAYADAAARRGVVDGDVGVLLVVVVKHRLEEGVDGVSARPVEGDRPT